MLTNIYGARCIGVEAMVVTVEVDITAGLGIHLVGLADVAVKESLLRTITALQSLQYHIPGKKIVINLAPADLRKSGSGYDVPIALGIIEASGQRHLPGLKDYIVMGELGLDGSLRPVPGALPIAELAGREGFKGCILPYDSAFEAVECHDISVFAAQNLDEVVRILQQEEDPSEYLVANLRSERPHAEKAAEDYVDFADIFGQEGAKRGMEIAAAGNHNAILVGPPGSGKSSLARALAGILPPMSTEEAIQTSKIYSVAGRYKSSEGLMRQRPFRAPHISISMSALVGGGSENILPGEISLAHNGVLFLDEFCEIPKRVIEALRGPMEDRKATISRLRSKVEYPASFMLVAASNPCPCGYYGEGDRCTCTPGRREAYISKLSGPIMDRIDIQLWLHPVDSRKLISGTTAGAHTDCRPEPSRAVAARVMEARERQRKRFAGEAIFTNAEMSSRQLRQFCPLDTQCQNYLEKIMENMGLSARSCSRILKLSRTIADLDGTCDISLKHICEAVGYRFLDKTL